MSAFARSPFDGCCDLKAPPSKYIVMTKQGRENAREATTKGSLSLITGSRRLLSLCDKTNIHVSKHCTYCLQIEHCTHGLALHHEFRNKTKLLGIAPNSDTLSITLITWHFTMIASIALSSDPWSFALLDWHCTMSLGIAPKIYTWSIALLAWHCAMHLAIAPNVETMSIALVASY
jgi:hypothetical protein